jgi:hypothetical protein
MDLAIRDIVVVIAVTVVLGVVGYFIDRSAARHEGDKDARL